MCVATRFIDYFGQAGQLLAVHATHCYYNEHVQILLI